MAALIWDLRQHFRILFQYRTPEPSVAHIGPTSHFNRHANFTSSPSCSPSLTSLDGLRAIGSLWIVFFHIINFSWIYQPVGIVDSVNLSILGKIPGVGYIWVDAFFLMTGFFMAYPLMKEEKKKLDNDKEHEKRNHDTTSTNNSIKTTSFSIPHIYSRRLLRLFPSLIAVLFFQFLLFPSHLQLSQYHNEMFRSYIISLIPEANLEGSMQNPCSNGLWIINLLFLNNLLPMGGCLPVTWSLCLQVQFYLIFPLLWQWAIKKKVTIDQQQKQRNNSKQSPSKASRFEVITVSSIVFFWMVRIWIGFIFIRSLLFWRLVTVDFYNIFGMLVHWYCYGTIWGRAGVMIQGVILAYLVVFSKLPTFMIHNLSSSRLSYLKQRSMIYIVCLFCFLGFFFLTFFYHQFYCGYGSHFPGQRSIFQTQLLLYNISGFQMNTGASALNVLGYWIEWVGFIAGSPLSGFAFGGLIWLLMYGVDPISRTVNSVLSSTPMQFLGKLSFNIFLFHPLIEIFIGAQFTNWYSPKPFPFSLSLVYLIYPFLIIITLFCSLSCYLFIERPTEVILNILQEKVKLEYVKEKLLNTGNNTNNNNNNGKWIRIEKRLNLIMYYYSLIILILGLIANVIVLIVLFTVSFPVDIQAVSKAMQIIEAAQRI